LATTGLASSTSPADTMAFAKSCLASREARGESSSFSLDNFIIIGCLKNIEIYLKKNSKNTVEING